MAQINVIDIRRALEAGWTPSDILDKMQEENAYLSDIIDRKRDKAKSKIDENTLVADVFKMDSTILGNFIMATEPNVTFMQRLRIAFGDDEGVKKFLEKKGFNNVRKDEDGWSYSVGKKRKLVDSTKLEFADIADEIPEIMKAVTWGLGAASGTVAGAVAGAVAGPPGVAAGAVGGGLSGAGVGNAVGEFMNQSIGNIVGTRGGADLIEMPKAFAEGFALELLLGGVTKVGKKLFGLSRKGLSITSGASEEAFKRQAGTFIDKKALEKEIQAVIREVEMGGKKISEGQIEKLAKERILARGAEQAAEVTAARLGEVSYKDIMKEGGEELKKFRDIYQSKWERSFEVFDKNPALRFSGVEIKGVKDKIVAELTKSYKYDPTGKGFTDKWGLSKFAGKPEQARKIDEGLALLDRYSKLKTIKPSDMNILKGSLRNFQDAFSRENAVFNKVMGENFEGSIREIMVTKSDDIGKALVDYGDKVGKYDALARLFEVDKDGVWDVTRKLGQFRTLVKDYRKEGLTDVIEELSATSTGKNLVEQIKNIDAGIQMSGEGALRAQIGVYGGLGAVMTGHPIVGLGTWISTRPSALAPILATGGKIMRAPSVKGIGEVAKTGARKYMQSWVNNSVERRVPVPQPQYNEQGTPPMEISSGSLFK